MLTNITAAGIFDAGFAAVLTASWQRVMTAANMAAMHLD